MKSPEAIAPCDTIVTDVISDGYKIVPAPDGTNEDVKRAKAFLQANQFKTRVLPGFLYDELVTGDAYIYKPRLSEMQVRNATKKIAKKLPLNNKENMAEYVYYSIVDEDTYRTKKLINIASSTVKIVHDKHGNVSEYVQKIGENTAKFTPKEVIHLKYMNVNGKIYSFCPMKAIIAELSLIASIKDNATNTFHNGGTPSHIFNLPEEAPGTKNVVYLEEQLRQFRQNVNHHRQLITTGKIDVNKLQNDTADMQYRELLEQITRIVYTIWGVPPSKMGQSGQDSGAYDSGLATEGYYRRVAHLQDRTYTQLNVQLMTPEFNVLILPNKSYLQDEVKDTQIMKQKFDIAQQGWKNNWVNKNWIVEYLDIEERHRGSFEPVQMPSMFRQGLMREQVVEGSTAKQDINKMRSDTQKEKTVEVKGLYYLTDSEREAVELNERL